ncbi:Fe-S cluster assembly transcription factor [Thiohalobacter sp. IOR34]|uniref:Fe-S cluster assembly transcription factor n=1 Tax=Thiohalobacter sp. IOR34 TaxID=3057176 RepID=UPI0025AFEA21|nr:Fe-S cluster assembly transcription factor [Thiohalobacter sp. IOR34]WJW76255.1 Fe-S cluster assembly transcription factor [Thiohalobacter sp. IOR34]
MKLTTKGRYAVTAMLDLTLHSGNGPVKLAEISGRQEISLSYLEQLFARLRKGGLVVSTRGPGGGYSLSRPADEIAVADVILAVDENMDTTRCGGMGNCQNDLPCLTHELWTELSNQIRSFLSDITLGQLVRNANVKQVAERQEQELQAPSIEVAVVEKPAEAS